MAATTCSFTSAQLSVPDSERCVKDRRSATKSSLIAVLENLQPTISARLVRQRPAPVDNQKITSEKRPRPQRGLFLVGNDTLECSRNFNWSGKEEKCQRAAWDR